MRQTSLQEVCRDILAGVEGALGCAVVDLQTGLPLAYGVKPGRLLSDAAMECLSTAGVAYFGPEAAGSDSVLEVQATTADAYHFMSLVPGGSRELLILITDRRETNLGMGWMSVRHALDEVRDADLYDSEPARESDALPESAEPPEEDVFEVRSRARRSIWD